MLVRRSRDERGIALSSPLALLSAAAVVAAGAALVVTRTPEPPAQAAGHLSATDTAHAKPSDVATSRAPRPVIKKHHARKPAVRRADVYVEVYNNSGIRGLAGRTAKRASGAGWQVVGSDNWYGTIPSSTVYYPAKLHAAAKLLAKDLGIHRMKPAIAPMKFDRLTVILTAGYS
ncbi:MAG TPA: LytR C-terminal domain-containing protein [Nocardioidaceae bacterium]|nr:LytR C-terminal domain-containing protein [Nocardioidaceae bacterium]